MAWPADAGAGTYHVFTCRTPNGSSAPADGWSASITGPFMYTTNTCPTALSARIDGGATRTANQTFATWSFATPANTEISAASLSRSGGVPGGVAGASWLFWLAAPNDSYDSADVFDQCASAFGCSSVAQATIGVPAGYLTAATHLYVHASCGGNPGTTCPDAGAGNPEVIVNLHWADLTLRDTSLPSAGAPSGPLVSGGTLSGTENVTFSASDSGSGIYGAHLIVDGNDLGIQLLDSNGGHCVDQGQTTDHTRGFLYATPCRSTVNASMSLDTTTLADGSHALQITAEDAAGDAVTVYSGRITVRNAPPPSPIASRPPQISGTPRTGSPLQASPGGWNGTNLVYTYQWQHCSSDGSACTSIVGATDSQYTIPNADLGRAMRVLVTATNPSGADTATSAPTSAVTNSTTAGAGSAFAPGGAAGAVLTRGPANGSGASDRARLTRLGRSASATVDFGKPLPLRGRLLDADGHPISNARLDLAAQVVGARGWSPLGSATTASDGSYRFVVLPGPSRLLRVSYRSHINDTTFSSTSDTLESVRAAARLRTLPRHVHNGRRVLFVGRTLGGAVPAQGKQVEIQVLIGRRWRDVVGARSNRDGLFRASYRFTRTTIRIAYVFRALVRQEGGYPYVTGTSNQAKVLVN
ncbi:MAG TPA: hypothetical protein VGN69_00765 [Solirubrobacteraceae bacterium]|nr:hypothetical protein [Solirubrobacteraceae bacterium]